MLCNVYTSSTSYSSPFHSPVLILSSYTDFAYTLYCLHLIHFIFEARNSCSHTDSTSTHAVCICFISYSSTNTPADRLTLPIPCTVYTWLTSYLITDTPVDTLTPPLFLYAPDLLHTQVLILLLTHLLCFHSVQHCLRRSNFISDSPAGTQAPPLFHAVCTWSFSYSSTDIQETH
jgi:hypothetical protein